MFSVLNWFWSRGLHIVPRVGFAAFFADEPGGVDWAEKTTEVLVIHTAPYQGPSIIPTLTLRLTFTAWRRRHPSGLPVHAAPAGRRPREPTCVSTGRFRSALEDRPSGSSRAFPAQSSKEFFLHGLPGACQEIIRETEVGAGHHEPCSVLDPSSCRAGKRPRVCRAPSVPAP